MLFFLFTASILIEILISLKFKLNQEFLTPLFLQICLLRRLALEPPGGLGLLEIPNLLLHIFVLLLKRLQFGSGVLIRPGKAIPQRSDRLVAVILDSSPENARQGAVVLVSEVGKNALQTLETSVTDIGLIFSGA